VQCDTLCFFLINGQFEFNFSGLIFELAASAVVKLASEKLYSATELSTQEIREIDTLNAPLNEQELNFEFTYLGLSVFLSKMNCCQDDATHILKHFRQRPIGDDSK
jgi:hypothetical protein